MTEAARSRLLTLLSAAWGLAAASPATARGQAAPTQPIVALSDPRLAELRLAATEWQLRKGPAREVVDQVCLVPDVATFYEAIAAWDESHYFPILIDDVDLDLKFLRAFHPARVVRYPGRGRPIGPGQAWERAVTAVGEAWSANDAPASARLKGDERPDRLGKTPPGVVLGRPESPTLPGLAALAAGRFQPLLRLDSPALFDETLGRIEADDFFKAVDAAVRARLPDSDRLGDDCDFLTLAGDYPYRYAGGRGSMAVDDRVGRAADGHRWAYAGRLLGDARRGVYAAMCSLFLRPDSAELFDGYSEADAQKKAWGLRPAAARLSRSIPRTSLAVGDRRASLRGWYEAFNPSNGAGLVMINSHGSARIFNLISDGAHALDTMPSVPAAVAMVHSYSAAEPTNPDTIAGRWLAQGAFLYFGSMDEPYINSFRFPGLIAELLASGLPFAAAFRPMASEPFGEPWKLVVLGDPLYTPMPRSATAPHRSRSFPESPAWVPYAPTSPPAPDAPEGSRLAWAVNAALTDQTTVAGDMTDAILVVLRTIDRKRLDPALRGIFDELQAVLLFQSLRFEELRAAFAAVPRGERSPVASRLAVSASMAEFQQALARNNFDRGLAIWSYLIRSGTPADFQSVLTARLGPLADTPARRDDWLRRLRVAASEADSPDARSVFVAELKRLEAR